MDGNQASARGMSKRRNVLSHTGSVMTVSGSMTSLHSNKKTKGGEDDGKELY